MNRRSWHHKDKSHIHGRKEAFCELLGWFFWTKDSVEVPTCTWMWPLVKSVSTFYKLNKRSNPLFLYFKAFRDYKITNNLPCFNNLVAPPLIFTWGMNDNGEMVRRTTQVLGHPSDIHYTFVVIGLWEFNNQIIQTVRIMIPIHMMWIFFVFQNML